MTDALEITNRRHDLVCFRFEDFRESELAEMGLLVFEDGEIREVLEIDTSRKKFQDSYVQNRRRYDEMFQERLKHSKTDLLVIQTDGNYLWALDLFFIEAIEVVLKIFCFEILAFYKKRNN